MGNRSGNYVQQPAGYQAFVPALLPPNPAIDLSGDMLALLSDADRALARLDGISQILPDADLFVTMYSMKEAVLSSQIEGTQSSLIDVLEFEAGRKQNRNAADVEEVTNYVSAMQYGLDRLETLPLSSRLLRDIHSVLMRGVRGSHLTPGEFRTSQNWIGPAGATLSEATFVPPPADQLNQSLGDLEKFIHSEDAMPPLIKCALIHYQFETIHPFLDGNGRIGRLLITFYLCWLGILERPLLYLSYYLKKNREEYYSRLSAVRENDDYEQWIAFFLAGVVDVSKQATLTARRIFELQERDTKRTLSAGITSPHVISLLRVLFKEPIISIPRVRDELGVTYQTASNLVSRLAKLGILRELTGSPRYRLYSYEEYLRIIEEGTQLSRGL
jgi:Fic family protein